MAESRYPSAREVAPRIRQRFVAFRTIAAAAGSSVMPSAPSDEDIEAIVDAAFWASLRREEDYLPRISLALLPPDRAKTRSPSSTPLPLGPVAPREGVARSGAAAAFIWASGAMNGQLQVWGTTRVVPAYCFVLEVAAPGLLVIKHHRGEAASSSTLPCSKADRIKMIEEQAIGAARLPRAAHVASRIRLGRPDGTRI